MPRSENKAIARAVLDLYGKTFAQDLKIHPERDTPSQLFRLLVFALLSSARIRYAAAVQAAGALQKEGWSTARKMAAATWEQRVVVLNRNGYARYDESTSRMLQDTSDLLLDKYGGDLRRLREAAGRDPGRERDLLKECKGIGEVGASIFFREVQAAWDEVYPFADGPALKAANRLGLPETAAGLKGLTAKKDFPRLIVGLVRVQLDKGFDKVRQAAAS